MLYIGTNAQNNNRTISTQTNVISVSRDEAEIVNKLLGLSQEQYRRIYTIYLEKNSKIKEIKSKYDPNSLTYFTEIAIAENSADQFVSQELTISQQVLWTDELRVKYTNNK